MVGTVGMFDTVDMVDTVDTVDTVGAVEQRPGDGKETANHRCGEVNRPGQVDDYSLRKRGKAPKGQAGWSQLALLHAGGL